MPNPRRGARFLSGSLLVGLMLVALAAGAQQPAPGDKSQTPPPPSAFGETLEVRIINLDVVVTTRDGKPVTGLTKDDFELVEAGKRTEISNFVEIIPSSPAPAPGSSSTAPAPAAPVDEHRDVRQRKLVFFVDNASVNPFNRNRVLKSMRRLLDEGARHGDAFMVITWNGNAISVPLQMTTDRAAADKVWDKLFEQTSAGVMVQHDREATERALNDLIINYSLMVPPRQPPYSLGLAEVRIYGEKTMRETRLKAEALSSVIAALRGVEGRKALMFVTEAFSDNPALSAFEYFDAIKEKFEGGNSQNPRLDAKEFEDNPAIERIADAANSAGVTVYPFHAGGLGADMASMDASNGSSIAMVTGGGSLISSNNDAGALEYLASATGGFAMVGTNSFDRGVSNVISDLGSYYFLGYRANGARLDKVTAVAVRLKSNKNRYVVRSRRSLVESSATTEMRDAVVANLFYPVSKNDLKVTIATGSPLPNPDPNKVVVPLRITIPTEQLTLMPDGSDLMGHFSVFGGFLRNDGAVSKIARKEQTFRFPAESLKRRKEVTVKMDLTAELGTEGISIGVVDEISHATGFAVARMK
jgi:VWFA-related protein